MNSLIIPKPTMLIWEQVHHIELITKNHIFEDEYVENVMKAYALRDVCSLTAIAPRYPSTRKYWYFKNN